jgi:hypothetical protein
VARQGFLGRIRQAIRNIVAPPQPPRRKAPPPPPEEPTGKDFRRAWRDLGGQGSYRKNLRVFHKTVDRVETDPEQQLELWETYITHINRGEDRHRRNSTSNMFWRDSGIDPTDWDWTDWREAMGYTGKRRSRTP